MSLPKVNGEVAKVWDRPEVRFTPGGKAVVSVPLVFNKRVKDRDTNEWKDAGELWVKGTAWEQFAENIGESLSKGDEVIVTGELSMREYERKDGSKGQSLELAIYAIGPNLKKHTARVSKVDRQGVRETAPADDPWGGTPANNEPPF